MVRVVSGVPQGFVLGPLLFLFYVNDLCHICLSRGSQTILYTDDLLLYKVTDSHFTHVSLQDDINRIAEWTNNNLFEFKQIQM